MKEMDTKFDNRKRNLSRGKELSKKLSWKTLNLFSKFYIYSRKFLYTTMFEKKKNMKRHLILKERENYWIKFHHREIEAIILILDVIAIVLNVKIAIAQYHSNVRYFLCNEPTKRARHWIENLRETIEKEGYRVQYIYIHWEIRVYIYSMYIVYRQM